MVAALTVALGLPGRAAAQEGDFAFDIDIEVPSLIIEGLGREGADSDESIDLANIVQTAARAVTTVQEAPAIVTIITAEDIRDRGLRTLADISDIVPGWMRVGVYHSQFPHAAPRGTFQSMLIMRDSVSMFDPSGNLASVSRSVPVETIKRIEMITGPGGVLWGANSYLGIMNVITKDAEDVDGIEAGVTAGHGPGDREVLRGYVMAGIPRLWSDDSKLFVHSSFDTYIGPAYQMPQHMFSARSPQPNSNFIYGPMVTSQQPRSMVFNFSGKLTSGNTNVYWSAPVMQRYAPMGFPGVVSVKNTPEDTMTGADRPELGLPPDQLLCPKGAENPINPTGAYDCLDADRTARVNQYSFFERYIIGEWRTRIADGKAGLAAKAYGTQFRRDWDPMLAGTPVPGVLVGGLSLGFKWASYRAGGALDGDLELPGNLRLLYGAEGFHEWASNTVTRSRQGEGVEVNFYSPYELERLPLPCPRQRGPGGAEIIDGCPLTMMFPASRSVLGTYLNPQWRPTKKLILDAGARAQVSPDALGRLSYPLQTLFSGALVYNFMPDWHAKLNYAQGFRPPVFNNVVANGESVQFGGRPDLLVETSDAYQGEINARLFKGERRLRELNFRADYSYTILDNLIQIENGRYENSGKRGIHSGEFLGKLYLKGGHLVELSYTWLRIDTRDKGVFKNLPEHWFNLGGVFNLIGDTLKASTNLRIIGSMEDPNRLVEHRDYGLDEFGHVINTNTMSPELLISKPNEVVMDRLPAGGELTAGLMWIPSKTFRLDAWLYNVLNARYYQPDVFFNYEPRLEILPNPYEDFRFMVSGTVSY